MKNIVRRLKTLIVPFGVFDHPAGPQVIDIATAEKIVARFDEWNRDLVVDYGHASMNQCDLAPAAGWVKKGSAHLTDEGIEAVIEWTDEARKLIAEKKYRFLSPVFEAKDGRIIALLNLGLTNNPNIHAMPALVNQLTIKEKPMESKTEEPEGSLIINEKKEAKATDEKKVADATYATLAERLGDVTALLGLSPDADDEEVIETIAKMAKAVATQKTEMAETMVNDAITAGRIAPSLKPWAKDLCRRDPESFHTYLVNSAQVVPLGGPITKAARTGSVTALSDEEQKICRSLGIDEKDFQHYKN